MKLNKQRNDDWLKVDTKQLFVILQGSKVIIKSYYTEVGEIDLTESVPEFKEYKKHKGSMTTRKHINYIKKNIQELIELLKRGC